MRLHLSAGLPGRSHLGWDQGWAHTGEMEAPPVLWLVRSHKPQTRTTLPCFVNPFRFVMFRIFPLLSAGGGDFARPAERKGGRSKSLKRSILFRWLLQAGAGWEWVQAVSWPALTTWTGLLPCAGLLQASAGWGWTQVANSLLGLPPSTRWQKPFKGNLPFKGLLPLEVGRGSKLQTSRVCQTFWFMYQFVPIPSWDHTEKPKQDCRSSGEDCGKTLLEEKVTVLPRLHPRSWEEARRDLWSFTNTYQSLDSKWSPS